MSEDNGEADIKERTGASGVENDHPVVDPTKNVLDLTRAESKYQDGMRGSLKEMHDFALTSANIFQNYAREQEARFQNAMRDVESKRVDQLSIQRQSYEERIADMLSESVRSTSALVSTQLLQIQSTFDARVNKLEEFRLTSQGRSSVSDPALAATLQALTGAVADLASNQSAAVARISTTVAGLTSTELVGQGATKQRADTRALAFALLGALGGSGIVGAIFAFFERVH